MRNEFGTELAIGNNLELLAKVSRWFLEEKGINIVRYYCCSDTTTRSKEYVKRKDLKKCEICKEKLYTIEQGSDNFLEDDDCTNVTQKKHMVLIDTYGRKHHTCFGINWCFGKTDYEVKEISAEDYKIEVPSFGELVDIENVDGQNELSQKIYEQVSGDLYDKYIAPFLKKWTHCEINKQNLNKFLSDWWAIQNNYLIYFEDDASSVFENKLWKIIGIDL